MKPIQINDSLIAIQVPKNAERFKIFNDIGRPYVSYFIGVDTFRLYIDYQSEIIGLVQTPELTFDFDVLDEWVESYEIDGVPTGFFSGKSTAKVYKNYVNPMIEFSGKNNSFRSRIEKAIQDSGLYLFNPYEKPYVRPNESNAMARILLRQYNEAESKTIKNNLLIIQKI